MKSEYVCLKITVCLRVGTELGVHVLRAFCASIPMRMGGRRDGTRKNFLAKISINADFLVLSAIVFIDLNN